MHAAKAALVKRGDEGAGAQLLRQRLRRRHALLDRPREQRDGVHHLARVLGTDGHRQKGGLCRAGEWGCRG